MRDQKNTIKKKEKRKGNRKERTACLPTRQPIKTEAQKRKQTELCLPTRQPIKTEAQKRKQMEPVYLQNSQ